MKRLLAAILLLVPASAHGQALTGPVRAVDGDTLAMTGVRIRLFGIDAPEAAQTCDRGGEAWDCGREASDVLASLVAGKQVSCVQRDRDDYGRVVAICKAGNIDLSEAMAGSGHAIALTQFSDAYLAVADRARSLGIGIWGSHFEEPAAWRAAHPQPRPERRVLPPAADEPAMAAQVFATELYFRNCDEARAAGVAPMRRGEAGYRPQLDADNDGVACEPYRGRG